MKTKVVWSEQVERFVLSQAPVPRRRLRLAIRALAQEVGDLKSLEGSLSGFSRLRVSNYRVVYKENHRGGARVIQGLFAERRAVVYEIFNQMVSDGLA
jgi:mRNA-degrading endonuclease RelE of RelBE toxin-antitoxin system